MYRNTIIIVLGFLLFVVGFIALVLMLVSIQLSFLTFIDTWGRTVGLVIRLCMIFGGVVMVYLARSKFED
jgi:hypothetical protein